MSATDDVTTTAVNSAERFIGRVKWFNTKSGYGFITVTDGPKSGTDVFVHHSAISVDSEQYKYLVQGEYIEFTLSSTMTDNHEYQASGVRGIKGGMLMCETRRDFRVARYEYRVAKNVDGSTEHPSASNNNTNNGNPNRRNNSRGFKPRHNNRRGPKTQGASSSSSA